MLFASLKRFHWVLPQHHFTSIRFFDIGNENLPFESYSRGILYGMFASHPHSPIFPLTLLYHFIIGLFEADVRTYCYSSHFIKLHVRLCAPMHTTSKV